MFPPLIICWRRGVGLPWVSSRRLLVFFALFELAARANAIVFYFAGHRAFSVFPIYTVAASFFFIIHVWFPSFIVFSAWNSLCQI